jgi:formylmethanofuran dehydrogenase subunit E
MNTKILSLAIVAIMFLASCSNGNNNGDTNKAVKTETATPIVKKQTNLYDKAGVIKVKDPMASLVGYRKAGEDYFEISLDDVGKYSGHVCAGISSGFILVKQALEKLYPNGEVPVRGQIRVAGQNGGDQFDVASYITGARAFYGRQEVNANDLIIDKSLAGKKGTYTMIFYRKDNGKMVKAVFNIKKLLTPKELKTIMPIKAKIEEGTATKEDKAQFTKLSHKVVKRVITNMPEGVITISECTNYKFPNK